MVDLVFVVVVVVVVHRLSLVTASASYSLDAVWASLVAEHRL